MRYIPRAAACFLLVCWAAIARADIEVKDFYEANEPIAIRVQPTGVPEGARLRGSLQVTDASTLQPIPTESVFYCWAGPGKHTVSASGVWVMTKSITVGTETFDVLIDFGQYTYVKTFTVAGEVPPVPPPLPPVPPVPPGERWAVIWIETEQQTPAQKNLYLQLRQEYQDGQVQIADVTNLPPSLRALESQRPPNLPLPVEMVLARQPDGTDKVVRTVPLPSSIGGVKEEISK
jgi:hypothetical protein